MKERKLVVWLAVLGTVFLIVFNLPPAVSRPFRALCREGLAVYQGAATRVLAKFQASWSGLVSGAALVAERDRLAGESAALRAQIRKLEAQGRENQQLRALLGTVRNSRQSLVACDVIAREDGYGWWQTIRLNKGLSSRIRENMAVTTPAGLVGRTLEVSRDSCDVQLISDRNCKVSVRFEPAGVFGILRGGGVLAGGARELDVIFTTKPCQVDFVRKDVQIKPGDVVMTSGLGQLYPPDILVGHVSRTYPDESGLYQHAEVVPVADLGRLRHVLVVTGK